MPIPVRLLVDRAAELFGLSAAEIMGASRKPPLVRARHAVCLVAVQSGTSRVQVGVQLGGRDHSTIAHGYAKAKQYCDESAAYRAAVYDLMDLSQKFNEASARKKLKIPIDTCPKWVSYIKEQHARAEGRWK